MGYPFKPSITHSVDRTEKDDKSAAGFGIASKGKARASHGKDEMITGSSTSPSKETTRSWRFSRPRAASATSHLSKKGKRTVMEEQIAALAEVTPPSHPKRATHSTSPVGTLVGRSNHPTARFCQTSLYSNRSVPQHEPPFHPHTGNFPGLHDSDTLHDGPSTPGVFFGTDVTTTPIPAYLRRTRQQSHRDCDGTKVDSVYSVQGSSDSIGNAHSTRRKVQSGSIWRLGSSSHTMRLTSVATTTDSQECGKSAKFPSLKASFNSFGRRLVNWKRNGGSDTHMAGQHGKARPLCVGSQSAFALITTNACAPKLNFDFGTLAPGICDHKWGTTNSSGSQHAYTPSPLSSPTSTRATDSPNASPYLAPSKRPTTAAVSITRYSSPISFSQEAGLGVAEGERTDLASSSVNVSVNGQITDSAGSLRTMSSTPGVPKVCNLTQLQSAQANSSDSDDDYGSDRSQEPPSFSQQHTSLTPTVSPTLLTTSPCMPTSAYGGLLTAGRKALYTCTMLKLHPQLSKQDSHTSQDDTELASPRSINPAYKLCGHLSTTAYTRSLRILLARTRVTQQMKYLPLSHKQEKEISWLVSTYSTRFIPPKVVAARLLQPAQTTGQAEALANPALHGQLSGGMRKWMARKSYPDRNVCFLADADMNVYLHRGDSTYKESQSNRPASSLQFSKRCTVLALDYPENPVARVTSIDPSLTGVMSRTQATVKRAEQTNELHKTFRTSSATATESQTKAGDRRQVHHHISSAPSSPGSCSNGQHTAGLRRLDWIAEDVDKESAASDDEQDVPLAILSYRRARRLSRSSHRTTQSDGTLINKRASNLRTTFQADFLAKQAQRHRDAREKELEMNRRLLADARARRQRTEHPVVVTASHMSSGVDCVNETPKKRGNSAAGGERAGKGGEGNRNDISFANGSPQQVLGRHSLGPSTISSATNLSRASVRARHASLLPKPHCEMHRERKYPSNSVAHVTPYPARNAPTSVPAPYGMPVLPKVQMPTSSGYIWSPTPEKPFYGFSSTYPGVYLSPWQPYSIQTAVQPVTPDPLPRSHSSLYFPTAQPLQPILANDIHSALRSGEVADRQFELRSIVPYSPSCRLLVPRSAERQSRPHTESGIRLSPVQSSAHYAQQKGEARFVSQI